MNTLDNKFTKEIQNWLNTPVDDRDIEAGALMLLKLNHNQFLYRNIILRGRSLMSTLEYEMKKHLTIRLKGMTLIDVSNQEQKVMEHATKSLNSGSPLTDEKNELVIDSDNDQPNAKHIGQRADHDKLSAEIQNLYVQNGDIYFQMKALYNDLLQMADKEPCDREEKCFQLGELDKEYRANWAKYDAAQVIESKQTTTKLSDKDYVSAKKFISDNKKLLTSLDADDEKTTKVITAMQDKINQVISSGGTFSPKNQEELKKYGLKFE